MSRVKLELPGTFNYATDVRLRVSDINYGGHMDNNAVLSLVHEARVRFLESHGFTELDVDGVGIIMVDAVIQYKSEAFYGQTLTFQVAVDGMTRIGCDVCYRITDRDTGIEVARAKTGIAFLDYATRKPKRMPEGFRNLFVAEES